MYYHFTLKVETRIWYDAARRFVFKLSPEITAGGARGSAAAFQGENSSTETRRRGFSANMARAAFGA